MVIIIYNKSTENIKKSINRELSPMINRTLRKLIYILLVLVSKNLPVDTSFQSFFVGC